MSWNPLGQGAQAYLTITSQVLATAAPLGAVPFLASNHLDFVASAQGYRGQIDRNQPLSDHRLDPGFVAVLEELADHGSSELLPMLAMQARSQLANFRAVASSSSAGSGGGFSGAYSSSSSAYGSSAASFGPRNRSRRTSGRSSTSRSRRVQASNSAGESSGGESESAGSGGSEGSAGGNAVVATLSSNLSSPQTDAAAVNTAPSAGTDYLVTPYNTALSIAVSSDLLANDSDAEGEALSLASFETTSVSTPAAAVVDNGDGTLTYTPGSGFSGTDYFYYTVADASGATQQGQVYVEVAPQAVPVLAERASGIATSAAMVSTSAAVTAHTDQLYLAAVVIDGTAATVTGVTGLGLTWTLVKRQCSDGDQLAVEVWSAIGSPGTDEVVTANLSVAVVSAEIGMVRYSGVDVISPIGTVQSENHHGIDGACGMPATAATSYVSAFTNTTSNAALFIATGHSTDVASHSSVTHREVLDVQAGTDPNATHLVVQYGARSSATTGDLDGNFSAPARWSVVGVEVKPAP